jgi:hypothetical protein
LHFKALEILESIPLVPHHHILWTKQCIISCQIYKWENESDLLEIEKRLNVDKYVNWLKDMIQYQTEFLPPDCPRVAESYKLLGQVYLLNKIYVDAQNCFLKALEIWEGNFGANCELVKSTMIFLKKCQNNI